MAVSISPTSVTAWLICMVTTLPALTDGDAVEAIGDAPISDVELAAPLPPLENFDVNPVEFAEADRRRAEHRPEGDAEIGRRRQPAQGHHPLE